MPPPGDEGPRSATAIALPILGRIPVGGALMLLCSSFALCGFPLDDLWHRLFGQDVTLWGPTHLIMLSGGLLTLVGCALLFEEGVAVSGQRRRAMAQANGGGGPGPGPGPDFLPPPAAR